MKTAAQHQSDYWDNVAGHIESSAAPDKNLVGYHSPYDMYVRRVAVRLLDQFSTLVPRKDCIAELGSGAGLNLRYFSASRPKKMLAFDCSPRLLALAKANLASLPNVEFIQTGGDNLPVPPGVSIDLLFTVTVLQHITNPAMYESVVASMKHSGAEYILIIEDTYRTARQVTPDYMQRAPDDYLNAFSSYALVASEFASLTWAARLFGLINRIFGLYKREEGAALPKPLFILTRILSPLAQAFDALFPGRFGMTADLFRKPAANG